MLTTTLSAAQLAAYVAAQASAFFPDRVLAAGELAPFVDRALERVEHCFSRIVVTRFGGPAAATFDHLNTDQYAMFLYFLSNTVYRADGDPALARKLYALNKALHALDAFYEVALPDVFFLQHPVGTVLGRARYADYFVAYQRCSVGSNLDGDLPIFEPGVTMFGGSAVIGRCRVGAGVCLSVGATLMDLDAPAGALVFGQAPRVTFKTARRSISSRFFAEAPEASGR